eukprot:9565351-Heterocapsa_arctica.AAC.1
MSIKPPYAIVAAYLPSCHLKTRVSSIVTVRQEVPRDGILDRPTVQLHQDMFWEKGCGYKGTWADKEKCFKCNIVPPKEIQFKPNPYQGW